MPTPIASLHAVPKASPSHANNPMRLACSTVLPWSISPIQAPKNGPINRPTGKKNIPIKVPIVVPHTPSLLALANLTPNVLAKISIISEITQRTPIARSVGQCTVSKSFAHAASSKPKKIIGVPGRMGRRIPTSPSMTKLNAMSSNKKCPFIFLRFYLSDGLTQYFKNACNLNG